MKIKRPHIMIEGIQVKSLEKFQRLAAAINVIEEECGIHQVVITLKDIFFCPWIDVDQCTYTPMERLLIGLINKMEVTRNATTTVPMSQKSKGR
jgi:hypothetical protein